MSLLSAKKQVSRSTFDSLGPRPRLLSTKSLFAYFFFTFWLICFPCGVSCIVRAARSYFFSLLSFFFFSLPSCCFSAWIAWSLTVSSQAFSHPMQLCLTAVLSSGLSPFRNLLRMNDSQMQGRSPLSEFSFNLLTQKLHCASIRFVVSMIPFHMGSGGVWCWNVFSNFLPVRCAQFEHKKTFEFLQGGDEFFTEDL